MQDNVSKITQWMIDNPPILQPDKEPATCNPFKQLSLPNYQEYNGNSRLGFIYQELCKRLFEHHSDFSVVADEIQLFEGKQTIGAIDFILKRQQKIEHWEVAIKFYLLRGGLWYGPDSRDRLDIKLDRMLTHQLEMSKSEAFMQRFPNLADITPKLLMHGRLYINPFEPETVPQESVGYTINPCSIVGNWCYQHQLQLVNEPLYKLKKYDWIAGTNALTEKLTELSEYAVHCQTLSGDFWFVVPDHWPK
ncbi:DUF1853 family protein [Vibrio sp. MA40-2]|uniref:DUF1853 family protein n=1 Tax=Vibrio sp. MA40-2 TaxID=3391828 RepID=UPI0039A77B7A